MSFTYFISDIHLTEDRPDITECLLTFLADDAREADALYVLGDLFEYWVGDDDITPFNTRVAAAFKAVSETIPVYFIHGNRDFAMRKAYAKRAGFQLLPEQAVVDLYGTPTLIMHGDELCTEDVSYQKFRKKARSWWWPRIMLAMPLWYRRKLKEEIQQKSRESKSTLTMEIMDVTTSEVERQFELHKVSRMIHGHTHRPAVHDLTINNEPAQRVVLGDWYSQGSMLKVSPEGIELTNKNF